MKKILSTIIIGTILTTGCAGTTEMKASIDELSAKLLDSEQALEEKEEERKREVNLLCALVGESVNDGLIQYYGDNTFKMPDGSFRKMDDMEPMCLEMIDSFEELVKNRAARE